jgi:hypothetical protein
MACCGGGCTGCTSGSAPKEERDSCRTCPNRQRCHGRAPEITEETLVRVICDAIVEVLAEQQAAR